MNDHTNESRSLIISDFRNLGITSPGSKTKGNAVLKVNRSLRKESLGGLVILLGSNNSGKSNVLSALMKVRKNEFDENDFTDFVKVRQNPCLTFSVAENRYGERKAPRIVQGQERCTMRGTFHDILHYILKQKESFAIFREYIASQPDRTADIVDYMNNNESFMRGDECVDDSMAYAHILRHRSDIICGDLEELIAALENSDYASVKSKEIIMTARGTAVDEVELVNDENYGVIGEFAKIRPVYVRKEDAKTYRDSQKIIKTIAKTTANIFGGRKTGSNPGISFIEHAGGVKETETVEDAYSQVYGYNLSDNVYQYNRRKISDTDFEMDLDKPNGFIPNLFTSLGYNVQYILSKNYLNSTENIERLEIEVNKELENISEMFNRMLNFNERPYSMKVRLSNSRILFTLKCAETKLRIDHQSEGFRWLFEFFFNFLLSKSFVTGDIVVIDEYGGLLNPGTVVELTHTLREFGKKNGVTFVLGTQNPLAIDLSHLEEIRIVSAGPDGSARILNDFTEFFGNDADVLEPITGCFTIGRNYLRDYSRPALFVENYADYFLLTAFGRLLGFDIDLIPVNRETDEDRLASELKKMDRKPVLFTDRPLNDSGFSDRMKEYDVTVASTADFGKDSLLNLLSEEDRAWIEPCVGSFDSASVLTEAVSEHPVSDESKDNFREILDYLSI